MNQDAETEDTYLLTLSFVLKPSAGSSAAFPRSSTRV